MSFLWRDVARNVSTGRPAPAPHPLQARLARRAVLGVGVTFVGTLALSGLLVHEARAADAAGSPADGARQFINDLANKAIAVMAEKSESDANRSQMFQALFVSSFDICI